MNLDNFLLFASIALIATLTPGPAIMLVTVNSVQYGVARAVLTILGNITGLFLMSLLAVLGISTIILYSAPAFFAVKIIGALYLCYLGIKQWKHGLGLSSDNKIKSKKKVPSFFKLYLQGLLIALSNPKAIAFTTALFPQFIDASYPLMTQFFILVFTFMLLSFMSLFGFAVLAIKIKNRNNFNFLENLLGKAFGSAFIGAGCVLAWSIQSNK